MLMQPVPCHAFTGVGAGVHVRMQRHAFVWFCCCLCLDTRDQNVLQKEGDKSVDRGLRLNRSRQQGRSTAYTTLIQLRGLRRI